MERFRRATLIALACSIAAPALTRDMPSDLSLHLGSVPGGLVIVNTGKSAITIERAIRVEQQDGRHWTPVITEMNATNSCANPATSVVRIAGGAKLSMVAWRGTSSSGQCELACRANITYGPGRFRFVVTTVAAHVSVVSPAFPFFANGG